VVKYRFSRTGIEYTFVPQNKLINMRKIIRILGFGLLSLLALMLVIGSVLGFLGQRNLDKSREIPVSSVAIPSDSASVAAGQRWAALLCTGCHGENYAGTKFMDVPALGLACAPNLTPAGIGKSYIDADWVRTIRHGLNPQQKALIIMPSENFQYLSDEHLGELVAYLKSLPPVEQEWPARKLTFMSMAAYQAGMMGLLPTEKVEHQTARATPTKAATADYGLYLANLTGCNMCHGADLKGGISPDAEAPPCPDISATSEIARWETDGFIQTMRTGTTPTGKALNPRFMPWREHGRMDDVQLRAVYAYLQQRK
jgi:mono/diheme cytochrome c family protein